MTMRLVSCDFCNRLGDFQAMFMCPRCRRTICPRCKKEGPLKPGQCARPTPCEKDGEG